MENRPGDNRVLRGGSWNNNATNVRVANRNNNDPWDRNTNNGFRLVTSQPGLTGGCPLADPGDDPAAATLWLRTRAPAPDW